MRSRLTTETLSHIKRRNPDLAKSIIERYNVPDDQLTKIHVLSLWGEPSAEDPGEQARSVSVIALLTRKLDVQTYGHVGVAIKCPDDSQRISVGFRIALGRAIRCVKDWS